MAEAQIESAQKPGFHVEHCLLYVGCEMHSPFYLEESTEVSNEECGRSYEEWIKSRQERRVKGMRTKEKTVDTWWEVLGGEWVAGEGTLGEDKRKSCIISLFLGKV